MLIGAKNLQALQELTDAYIGWIDANPQQQFADLAEVSVPVPTLLGPRGMRGDAEGSVLTASADGATPAATGELASVPVPANRPAVAEALLAAANADPEGEDDLAETQQDTLSPTVVAALEQSGQAARSQVQSAVTPTAAPFPAAVNHKVTVAPAETAKAEPQPGFGDAFDLKPAINSGLTAGLPTKGARPSKQDAAVSHQAMVGGGRLTQDLISDWALNQNKGTTGRSVKAPRVVANRMLSHDMSASATSASFKPGAVAIESSRFSTPVKMH